jgi:hypothetical protein
VAKQASQVTVTSCALKFALVHCTGICLLQDLHTSYTVRAELKVTLLNTPLGPVVLSAVNL